MKTSNLILIAAIVLSGAIGFILGRNSAPTQTTTIAANGSTAVNTPPTTKKGEATDLSPTAKNKKSDKPTAVTVSEPATKPEPKSEVKKPEPTKKSGNTKVAGRSIKGISDIKIGSVLSTISENLEAKNLSYNSSLMQDCSGIYHQLKDSIQSRIPVLSSAEYVYPPVESVRSSRQIADWYYTHGNLTVIEDAIASRNVIRPGTVLFFGRSGKKYSNIDIEMLTDKSNGYTRNGAIMHVAVVTEIQTDENGDLVNYTMMHGRSSRYPASRSGSMEVQSKNTKNLPPFGHWNQQLVAIADIATRKK